MDFPLSTGLSPNFQYLEETGSTNMDLLSSGASLPEFSVLVTDYQSSGRGRLDRGWEASKGSSLMASILLKPKFTHPEGFGWLSLLAALAIKDVTQELLPAEEVKVKWPNDVLVNGKKLSGILAEASKDLDFVVVGFGINLTQKPEELPVPTATSLAMFGVTEITKDAYLFSILKNLQDHYQKLVASAGSAEKAGLLFEIQKASGTIGKEVEISYPDGRLEVGLAVGIDQAGRLRVLRDGLEVAISAADIQHLRGR